MNVERKAGDRDRHRGIDGQHVRLIDWAPALGEVICGEKNQDARSLAPFYPDEQSAQVFWFGPGGVALPGSAIISGIAKV